MVCFLAPQFEFLNERLQHVNACKCLTASHGILATATEIAVSHQLRSPMCKGLPDGRQCRANAEFSNQRLASLLNVLTVSAMALSFFCNSSRSTTSLSFTLTSQGV